MNGNSRRFDRDALAELMGRLLLEPREERLNLVWVLWLLIAEQDLSDASSAGRLAQERERQREMRDTLAVLTELSPNNEVERVKQELHEATVIADTDGAIQAVTKLEQLVNRAGSLARGDGRARPNP